MRNAREAKLHTRCGMGPCQGRICAPATAFLFGWEGDSVRPPILPAAMRTLATKCETERARINRTLKRVPLARTAVPSPVLH